MFCAVPVSALTAIRPPCAKAVDCGTPLKLAAILWNYFENRLPELCPTAASFQPIQKYGYILYIYINIDIDMIDDMYTCNHSDVWWHCIVMKSNSFLFWNRQHTLPKFGAMRYRLFTWTGPSVQSNRGDSSSSSFCEDGA